jgi:hypothetical protein
MSELLFEHDDQIFLDLSGHLLDEFIIKLKHTGLSDNAPNTDSWLDSDSQI